MCIRDSSETPNYYHPGKSGRLFLNNEKNQMAAYGQNNPDEKELNSILQRIMSNQDEVKRISNQIISEKLLLIYKEKVNKKIKKVSYEEYIEIAYKKNN